MADHNKTGNEGEEQARIYLQQKGYQIRHCNWLSGKLELDIVAEKDGWLVVVEVKTRSTEIFEHPKEAITPRKIKNIINATHDYIMEYDWQGETRFDVIAVIRKGQKYKIEHIEDAFMPPLN